MSNLFPEEKSAGGLGLPTIENSPLSATVDANSSGAAFTEHTMANATQATPGYENTDKDELVTNWASLPQEKRNEAWVTILAEKVTQKDNDHAQLLASVQAKITGSYATQIDPGLENPEPTNGKGPYLVNPTYKSTPIPKLTKDEALLLVNDPDIKRLVLEDYKLKRAKSSLNRTMVAGYDVTPAVVAQIDNLDSDDGAEQLIETVYQFQLLDHISKLHDAGVDTRAINEDGTIDPTMMREGGEYRDSAPIFDLTQTAGSVYAGVRLAKTAAVSNPPAMIALVATELAVDVGIDITAAYLEDKHALVQIFGPMGAALLLNASAKGIEVFGAKVASRGKSQKDAVMAMQRNEGTIIARLQDVFKEIDAGTFKPKRKNEQGLEQAIVARVMAKLEADKVQLDNAPEVTKKLFRVVSDAVTRPETPMGSLAKRAMGVGNYAPLLSLGVSPEMDIKVLAGLGREDLAQLFSMQDVYTKSMLMPLAEESLSQKELAVRGTLLKFVSDTGDKGYGPIVFSTGKTDLHTTGAWLKKWFFSPNLTLEKLNKNLVAHMTNVNYANDKHIKYVIDAIDQSYSGLSKVEASQLDGILTRGSQEGKVFNVVSGVLVDEVGEYITGNHKIIESYRSVRMVEDHMWSYLNKTVNDNLTKNGVRQLKGTEQLFTQVKKPSEGLTAADGRVLTKEDIKNKVTVWEEINGNEKLGPTIHIMDKDQADEWFRDVSPTMDNTPFYAGHVARSYTSPWMVTEFRTNKETGELYVAETRTASTYREAQDYVGTSEQQMISPNALPDGGEPVELTDEVEREARKFVISRRDNFASGVYTSLNDRVSAILGKLDEESIAKLETQLVEAGLSPEEAKSITGKDGLANVEKTFRNLRKRGAKQLLDVHGKPAETLNTRESLLRYASSTLRYADKIKITNELETAIEETYGQVVKRDTGYLRVRTAEELDNIASTQGRIDTPTSVKLKRLAAEAEELLKLHAFFRSQKTGFELVENELIKSKANNFFERPFYKALSKKAPWFDKMVVTPLFTNVTASDIVRNVVKAPFYHAMLGMLSLSSGAMQTVQLLNLGVKLGQLPYGSEAIKRGTGVMLNVLSLAKGFDGLRSPEALARAKYDWEILERSGFTAGLNFKSVDEVMDGRVGVFASAKDVSMKLFKTGEAFQRSTFFLVEREHMIAEIFDKGKLIVDGKILKKTDIDSDFFLNAAKTRANKFSFDFQAINKAHVFRAGGEVASLPFMLQQYSLKQLELMFDQKLTWPERMGLWGTWTGAFGLAGLPLFSDTITIAETLSASATKNPDDYGAVRRQLGEEIIKPAVELFAKDPDGKLFKGTERQIMKGLLTSISDGDIDVAHRATLDSMLSQYFESKSVDEIVAGPGVTAALDMLDATYEATLGGNFTFWEGVRQIAAHDVPLETGIATLRKSAVVKQVSSLNAMAKAAEMAATGKIKAASGSVLANDPTFSQIVMQGMGFTPGGVVEIGKDITIRAKQDRLVKAWKKEVMDKYTGIVANGSPKLGREYLQKKLEEIRESGHPYAARWMLDIIKAAPGRVLQMKLTDEQRTKYRIFRDPGKAYYDIED